MADLFAVSTSRRDFDEDISRWDVSAVTNMYGMFFKASVFNADLNGWNVSQVTNMQIMLGGAFQYDQDLDGWDDKVKDWGAITTTGIFSVSPMEGANSPCWLTGRPCHSFELDIDRLRSPTSEDDAVVTVLNPTNETVYTVGVPYRIPPLKFSVRNHAKGKTSTPLRLDLLNAPVGFTLNTKTGMILGTFTASDIGKSQSATLVAVDEFGRQASVENFTMLVRDRTQFIPVLGDRRTDPHFYSLKVDASSGPAATMIAIGAANTFRLAPPNILPVENGTLLSSGTVGDITFTFEMHTGANRSKSTTMEPNQVAMKPSGEVIGYFAEDDIGDCFVTITAIDGGGDVFVLASIWFDVRWADVDVPAYGPNGRECANNGKPVDGEGDARFDGIFECNCEETLLTVGENCDRVVEICAEGETNDWQTGGCLAVTTATTANNANGVLVGSLIAGFILFAAAGMATFKYREHRLSMQAFDFQSQLLQLRASGEIPIVAEDADDTLTGNDASRTDIGESNANAPLTRGIPREIKRRCISRTDKIGSGAFGEVYKGVLDESQVNGVPGYLVACKSVATSTGDGADDLKFEATVMAQVGSHENLVSLIGVVTSGLPLLLVVSYCEHGSLLAVLRNHAGTGAALKLDMKLKLVHETSRGMAYLCSRHFIHRDLAARNVLVASGMVAKVADFGLSRSSAIGVGNSNGAEYYRSKNGVFSVRWTAPEAMEESVFTQASDVWSFGIVLVEVLQDGVVPYGVWVTQYVMTKVMGGHKHEKPLRCPDALYSIMLECWSADPNQRPLFSNLVMQLKMFIDKQVACGLVSRDGFGYLDVDSGAAAQPSVDRRSSINTTHKLAIGHEIQTTISYTHLEKQSQGLDSEGYVDDCGSAVGRIAILDADGYVHDRSDAVVGIGASGDGASIACSERGSELSDLKSSGDDRTFIADAAKTINLGTSNCSFDQIDREPHVGLETTEISPDCSPGLEPPETDFAEGPDSRPRKGSVYLGFANGINGSGSTHL
jgi:surface protein